MRDGRFTPESGHVQCNSACPLCANSGHVHPLCTRPLAVHAGQAHIRADGSPQSYVPLRRDLRGNRKRRPFEGSAAF